MTRALLTLLRALPWRYRQGVVARIGREQIIRSLGGHIQRGKFLDIPVELDLADHIQFAIFLHGLYDKPFLTFFKRILQAIDSPVVLDVGANIGNHAVFMARWSKAVHAFEPNETARRHLEKFVQTHGCRNLSVHPVALGESPEEREFFENADGNLGSSTFVSEQARVFEKVIRKRLRIERGDDYLYSARIGAVHVMKIDVEGFELEVLSGLRHTIASCRPVIVMEYLNETHRRLSAAGVLDELLPRYRKWALHLVPAGPAKYLAPVSIRLEPFDPHKECPNVLMIAEEACERFTGVLNRRALLQAACT